MNWNYISGFFDADGSVTMIAKNKGDNKSLQLSFSNCERVILEEIKEFIFYELKIKGFISTKTSYKENHSTNYELKYTYNSAYEVLNRIETIHPKKKHRKDIFELIRKFTPRNGRYSEYTKLMRNLLVEEFFSTDY